eukprot:SAG31_NODE_18850_length_620_cov_1.126679_1_plen_64_part_10
MGALQQLPHQIPRPYWPNGHPTPLPPAVAMHPPGALLLLVGEENPVAAALGAERVVVGVEHEGT